MHALFTTRIGLVALAALGVCAPVSAAAQTVPGTPYQLARAPHTFVPLSSPTVIWADVDDETAPVTLPFPVKFYDTTQTSLSVGSNGAITFPSGTTISRFNNVPGTTGAPSGFVAPLWDDLLLDAAPDRSIGYQVEGTSPTRTITFEWRNVGFYDFGSQAGTMNFQVRFHEGASGRIDIDYGPASGTFSGSATMGMENTMDAGPILFLTNGCTSNCTLADFPANTRVSLVQDPGVDLVAAGIEPPEFAFLGAETRVPVVVQNLHGNPIGPFVVSVVASPTAALETAIEVGSVSTALAPFEVKTIDLPTIMPTSLGTNPVFVAVVVDSTDAIAEVEENNNTMVSATRVRLLVGKPDLAVDRVRTSVSRVTAGDSFDVYVRMRNVGSDPASSIESAIILSTNPVISQQDMKLALFDVTLMPGETSNATVSVTIDPATNSGAYFIGALADHVGALDELSESNNGLADIGPIEITGRGLAVVSTALPRATVRNTYGAVLNAAGGDPADRTWSIETGNLPTGLGIVPATGEIFGRPTVVERQTFVVRVASGGASATAELTLEVVDPSEPLTIVTRELAAAVVGQEYTFGLVATGGTQPELRMWSSDNLPDGFEIQTDGLLVGTPIDTRTATITVTLTDGIEITARELRLVVRTNPNLLITPTLLSTGRFGEPYRVQLEATGAAGAVAWLLDLGRLPAGLNLSTDGEISGTPMQVGRFRFVVEARDTAAGLSGTDKNTFELDIVDDETFVIETSKLPDAFVGVGYEAALRTTGGLPPIEWDIEEGRLPDGMVGSVDDATGDFRIVGQATTDSVATMLVVATDARGRQATRAVVLRALVAPPMDDAPDDDGCSCNAARGDSDATSLAILLVIGAGWFGRRRRR